MPTHNVTQLYMGIFDDLDPVEFVGSKDQTNELTEVPGWAPDVVFKSKDLQVVNIIQNDETIGNDTGKLEENDLADRVANPIRGDSITYDLGDGNGPITSYIDSAFNYNATFTLADTGEEDITTMQFIQLENGAIFTNSNSYLDNKTISKIKLYGPARNDFYGTETERSADGLKVNCYASGTLIRTPRGEVAVEDLAAGDLVNTVDDGAAPILWIGHRKLDRVDLQSEPQLRPILIRAGALGEGLPVADLVVSPQHRILVRGAIPQRMFGQAEILVAAKQLVELPGIEVIEDTQEVAYFHLLLADHQLVWANGAPAETMFAGVEALGAMTPDQSAELSAIFPEIAGLSPDRAAEALSPAPARLLAPGRRARRLAERLKKNGTAPISRLAA
ncbi:Hint domain-containing protein [Paracoccus isoporae]|uniref:Hint domain-containing protein n=1 Tax=Paracoccus isoporae TaxID=591205 RepID=A0A1G7DDX4_9RHOB|nr:Hint domain-containing protein [Paracoccus isoporae]SDE49005.1 Hint domain-containing protein [Paracoccus isoporae]